jgi:DNA-binding MarR family transcriptional regulator
MLQTELARDLDVGKVTVGGLIDRLEAGGYVQRLAVATDRRAKRVVITPLGHEVLAQMVTVGHRLNEIILEGVPKADLAIAARTLELMKDNLRQATLDRDQVDLPVGIEDTEEATRAAGGAAGRPVRSATAR